MKDADLTAMLKTLTEIVTDLRTRTRELEANQKVTLEANQKVTLEALTKQAKQFVTHEVVAGFAERTGKAVGKRLAEIEARVQQLEAQPVMRYVGPYRDGVGYEPGAVCTFGGSMWHANKTTAAKPGAGDDWVLCVKHGRDLR